MSGLSVPYAAQGTGPDRSFPATYRFASWPDTMLVQLSGRKPAGGGGEGGAGGGGRGAAQHSTAQQN